MASGCESFSFTYSINAPDSVQICIETERNETKPSNFMCVHILFYWWKCIGLIRRYSEIDSDVCVQRRSSISVKCAKHKLQIRMEL